MLAGFVRCGSYSATCMYMSGFDDASRRRFLLWYIGVPRKLLLRSERQLVYANPDRDSDCPCSHVLGKGKNRVSYSFSASFRSSNPALHLLFWHNLHFEENHICVREGRSGGNATVHMQSSSEFYTAETLSSDDHTCSKQTSVLCTLHGTGSISCLIQSSIRLFFWQYLMVL